MVYTIYVHLSRGGGLDGVTYTNSLEAWENSYNNGNRVIDADLRFTSDGHLVLRHEWNDNMEQTGQRLRDSDFIMTRNNDVAIKQRNYKKNELDYNTFMSTLIMSRYHPMDVESMLIFMKLHPDVYVAADVKEDIVNVYRVLCDTAKQLNCEDVLAHIIVSVYGADDYQAVKQVFPFENFVIRQYINRPHNYYKLAEFCVENDIHVVNVSAVYMEDEGIKLLTSHGIHVYAAVVDDIEEMQHYQKLGASGAVTSFLRESDRVYFK